jgi:hypothetical protein
LGLNIFSIEDLDPRPNLSANKGESQVGTPTSVRQRGVDGEAMSLAVELLGIRGSVLVSGQQLEFVKVSGRGLDVCVVRRQGVLDLLDVETQGRVVLLHGVLASDVQLRADGSLPLLGGILLDLGGTRSTMLLSKGSSRDVGLFLDAVKVGLDLLNVRRGIGIIVRLEVRNSKVPELEVRLANVG